MAIATIIPNPWVGLPLAFLSHFVVDKLPHWNWEPDARPLSLLGIVLDLILLETLVVRLAFHSSFRPYLAATAFLAILPDLVEAPYIFFGFDNRHLRKLCRFQKRLQNRAAVLPGLVTQILLSALCVLILTR